MRVREGKATVEARSMKLQKTATILTPPNSCLASCRPDAVELLAERFGLTAQVTGAISRMSC